jgi:hypothetical protein
MIRRFRYEVQRARRGCMKLRAFLFAIAILGTASHAAAAQPKKTTTQVDAPSLDSVLANTSIRPNPVLADLIAPKPEMPLGPQDVLKAYEIAMNSLSDKTSTDFSLIVQAQHANQITRGRAEYLLQQRYEIAMMQYQVLSALHDVLLHDIEEATQRGMDSVNTARSNTVPVPLPDIASAGK